MPTRIQEIKHVETATGTYELKRMVRDYWVVWSCQTHLPLGLYEDYDKAVKSLNEIKVGEPLLHPSARFGTIDEVVAMASTFFQGWDSLPSDLSLAEKCLVAARRSEDHEDCLMMTDLAMAALRLERGDAEA